MMSPNKLIISAAALLTALFTTASADTVAEQMKHLAGRSNSVYNQFLTETVHLQLQTELQDRFFTTAHQNQMADTAKTALSDLTAILADQNKIRIFIEEYDQTDWHVRFRQTDLWKTSVSNSLQTQIRILNLKFWFALTRPIPARATSLTQILNEIDDLESQLESHNFITLKLNCLYWLNTPRSKNQLETLFKSLLTRSDLPHSTAAEIQLQYIRFRNSPQNLAHIIKAMTTSAQLENNRRLILSFAALSCRFSQDKPLLDLLESTPQIKSTLGRLLFDRMISVSSSQLPTAVTPLQIDIAVAYTSAYPDKFNTLVNTIIPIQRLRTPFLLYTAGLKQYEKNDQQAIRYWIDAINTQSRTPSALLKITPARLSEKVVRFAYNLAIEKAIEIPLLEEAFENHFALAGQDPELIFHYSQALRINSEYEKAADMLEKLTTRSDHWAQKAQLELIRLQIATKEDHAALIAQLRRLAIETNPNTPVQNAIRFEALEILFKLESADLTTEAAARIVSLIAIFNTRNCDHAPRLVLALDENLRKFELTETLDFSKLVDIARFCRDCLPSRETDLIFAEYKLLAASSDEDLSSVEKILDEHKNNEWPNLNYLRTKARFLTSQGKFAEASGLWGRIASIYEREHPSNSPPSWQWWRAKYYELENWAKLGPDQSRNIPHNIQVLQHSFEENIPPLWGKKLISLRKKHN